ncbi:MAG: hypothetical protein ACRD1R_01660 [Acidobacteriota bacterium]
MREQETPITTPDWPTPDPAALYGLAGDIVRAIEPHTEADPAALLVQMLTMYGSVIGRDAYFPVQSDRHHCNIFSCLVGNTAKGRKGTSQAHIMRVFRDVDEIWAQDCVVHGLSTGEGLIWAVRDAIDETKPVRSKGRYTGESETTTVDYGITDKRLLVIESEFARLLNVMQRDSNTLSAVIRQAWDSGDLRTMTKASPARATGGRCGNA